MLRAFAAISVVVYHVIEHFHWTTFPWSGWIAWFRIGWMGVDCFFVISGFVIALSAFGRVAREGPTAFRAGFLRDRLARIAPLHYLTCAVFVMMVQPALLFVPTFPALAVSHLLFVYNFLREHHGAINGVNWSVATEMQFYVLVALCAPWLLVARWWTIAAVGWGVAVLWRAAAFWLIPITGSWGIVPLWQAATQLPGMLDEFTLGILLARLVRSQTGRHLLDFLAGTPFIMPVVATSLTWGMLHVYWQHATFWDSAAMVVAFRSWIGAAAATWLVVAMTLPWPSVVRLSAPLRYLGTISYGIYLWHLSIIMSLHGLGWLSGRQALPYVLTGTIAAASLSWHFFERPLLSARHVKTSKSSRSGAPESLTSETSAQAEAAANRIRLGGGSAAA